MRVWKTNNSKSEVKYTWEHIIDIDSVEERMDFFIKNILSKELLEKFKKNPKKLIKFSLVYQENILGFKYVDDLKRFLFKEITE